MRHSKPGEATIHELPIDPDRIHAADPVATAGDAQGALRVLADMLGVAAAGPRWHADVLRAAERLRQGFVLRGQEVETASQIIADLRRELEACRIELARRGE